MKRKYHLLLLPLIFISLIIGMWTGLIRVGWALPLTNVSGEHGSFMIGSFLGTLIALERTVTYKHKISLIIPAISALSVIFFLADMDNTAYWLLFFASVGLSFLYLFIYLEHPDIHMLIMMAGAMCWAVGNLLLINTHFYPNAVTWWMAFLFYTIMGERLDLSKYLFISKTAKTIFIVFLAIFMFGIFFPFHGIGGYIFAFSLIASALWLYKYDMAKKSLMKPGTHRFSGTALLIGYGWLIISGLLMAYGAYIGLYYDATLHTFFLGFVFSMIFAHAAIILPGVLGISVSPYHPLLYVWLILLQLSIIIRYINIFTLDSYTRSIGSLMNGIIIILFFLTIMFLVRRELRKQRSGSAVS